MSLKWIYLNDVEFVNENNLTQTRLRQLENGICSFEDLIYGNCSDPITLGKSTKPYRIIDGRHRIYLARKKGYKKIKARLI